MTTPNTIRIHHILRHSNVNGPGDRFVVWTQGCSLRCKGCFNPNTHDIMTGYNVDINELANTINCTVDIRGITLTGGEPLMQVDAISKLLSLINKNLDILLFSGYSFDEIRKDSRNLILLKKIDAALLGRYNNLLSHPFYGKKLVLSSNRIKKEELKPWLNTEIIIGDNNVQVTGLYKQAI